MVDEALAVLGLSGSPEHAEIRRAYLRKVKEHPPERDADGFRRVREAYDFLKENPWRLAQRERAEGVVEAPSPEPAPAPVVVAEQAEQEQAEQEQAEQDAEKTAEEAWKASFPPFIREQIDALNRALEGDDPAAAAEAMIELYGRPLLEAAPAPPPILALRTYIVLVERGRLKLGKSLLAAFERYMDVQQVPLSGGGEIGARWKLAREVQATLELDKPLGRAVAAGLRSGQLIMASDAVVAAYGRHERELERHMNKHAPTLWASLAPMLRSETRVVRALPTGNASGFRMGSWPIGVIAVVLLNLVRLCGGHESKPATTSFDEPTPIRAAATPPAPEPAAPTTRSPRMAFDKPMPYLSPEVVARQRPGTWAAIELALQIGDCQAVREQWPLYRAALPRGHVDVQREQGRKRHVLVMCSELKDLLEEP